VNPPCVRNRIAADFRSSRKYIVFFRTCMYLNKGFLRPVCLDAFSRVGGGKRDGEEGAEVCCVCVVDRAEPADTRIGV
jgi:hypothetical protein